MLTLLDRLSLFELGDVCNHALLVKRDLKKVLSDQYGKHSFFLCLIA